LGPAPTEPDPPVLFAALGTFPSPARTFPGLAHVASGTVFVIATHREPLPASLGRSLPAASVEARERSLVRAAQRGSSDAVEELFRRHWPAAHRAAYLIVQDAAAAEDIAQEAFVAALRALDRFDRRRPFAPWLHRIVINRALDLLRSERRLVGLDVAAHPSSEWRDVSADDRALLEAVATLTPQRRVVIVLRYGLGYSPSEIARMLELPTGTVNSRLARALDDLRERERERDAERT
jgi:RNA polymerase sigma-70 factor, ECF subfamily